MYSEYVLLPCLAPFSPVPFSPPANNVQNIVNWRGVPCFFTFLYPWGAQTSRNIQPVSRRHLHLSGPHGPCCVKSFTPGWGANCDDDPMCSHILGSLHSVLESQQNQHHKWMKWISVEFQASCHGSWEDYFWTGPPLSVPQNVLHRQLPSPLSFPTCFKWWMRHKEKLVLLREGDNTVK